MRLKKIVIIKNVQPIIDLEKIENVTLNIVFIKTNPKESNTVALSLKNMDEITNLCVASGNYDLIAKTITANQSNFEYLRQEIIKIKGVMEMIFQTLTKVIKDDLNILLKKRPW